MTMGTKLLKNLLSGLLIITPFALVLLKSKVIGEWYLPIIIVNLTAVFISSYISFRNAPKALLGVFITVIIGLTFFGIVYFYRS